MPKRALHKVVLLMEVDGMIAKIVPIGAITPKQCDEIESELVKLRNRDWKVKPL
jgi:hypothetical protein